MIVNVYEMSPNMTPCPSSQVQETPWPPGSWQPPPPRSWPRGSGRRGRGSTRWPTASGPGGRGRLLSGMSHPWWFSFFLIYDRILIEFAWYIWRTEVLQFFVTLHLILIRLWCGILCKLTLPHTVPELEIIQSRTSIDRGKFLRFHGVW